MLELSNSTPIIGDLIGYSFDPNNRGAVEFALLGMILPIVIVALLTIFSKSLRNLVLYVWKWWDLYKINPDLDMEISISGKIPPTVSSDFVLKMRECLGDVSNSHINLKPDDSFEFTKNFNSFSGNIIVSPGFDSQSNSYNFLYIRTRTTDIKLKKVEDGLGELQIYLFRDIYSAITRKLKFEVDKDNEGISVMLEVPPIALRLPGGLNVDTITAHDEGIRVTFSADNISINGSIEPRTIEKIENIIRSNLST